MAGWARMRQAFTLLLAIVLVIGSFAPVAAYPTEDTGLTAGEQRSLRMADAMIHQLNMFAEPAPRTQKRMALASIRNLSSDGQLSERADRAEQLVNATLDAYRDDTRVSTERVFRNDAKAVQAVAPFVSANNTTRASVEAATRLITDADQTTAAVAISDANHAVNLTAERTDSPGEVRAARAHLANAEDAYSRGKRILNGIESESLDDRVRARARALRQFGTAWRQAQLAIDRVDTATNPRVVIQSRSDFPRNGSTQTTRRIVGDVVDVQAYELDNATVRVNGGPPRTIPLETSPVPGENATFATNVTFTQRNTTIEITVVDAETAFGTGDANSDDENGDRGKNDGAGPPTDSGPPDDERNTDDERSSQRQAGTDRLRLDGDGLSDRYEVRVTQTDPLDPDSDANRTAVDEANNGIPDGIEDFDDDGVFTFDEFLTGTDPFATDTDGDGLLDKYEIRSELTDPTLVDTDDDGVPDPEEDFDADGLTTATEAELGTLPDAADTDQDGLSDATEVNDTGTDPLLVDTDGDGLDDGRELDFGFDPLNADSDGDGITDRNETVSLTTASESGVTVATDGIEITPGERAPITVRDKPSFFNGTEAAVGPTVRVENTTTFDQATISIPLNDSVSESNYDDLAIYTWNGSTTDRWTPLDTQVTNGTARATVEKFSFFTVLDTDEWVSTISFSGRGDPIAFREQRDFVCGDGCNVTDETTLTLGGEPSANRITVKQGDTEFEVVPLSNGQSIEEFYDYGDAEINSPLPVAKSDASRLFFWSGPNGISLVVVHDKPRDGSGAAVDLAFDGLPLDTGRWVVQDDPNDFRRGSLSRPYWTWNDDNTDGGAFRGGLTDRSISITPYFNEQASEEPLTPGELTRWQVLTGQATQPDAVDLSLTDPVTVTIPEAPSDEDDGIEGDTGRSSFTRDLSGTEQLAIVYQTEQTDINPSATLTIEGQETTLTKELNIGTVGTVREVFDVSQIDGDATIRIAVDGVNLNASVVPGFGRLDTDGDGIPDAIERRDWVAANGDGTAFSLDPTDADTDGDGLSDGEEVDFVREEVDGELTVTPVLRSAPDDSDTDDDGLTDRREREGWTINISTSRFQTERAVTADTTDRASTILTQRTVTSNPLLARTDGDTLDDAAEYDNGTHPERVDTDRDTVADGREVRGRGDPTLFDDRAPRVIVTEIDASGDPLKNQVTYTVRYQVTDPSGVTRVEFIKKGEVRGAPVTFLNVPETGIREKTFSFPGYETLLADGVIGPRVKVRTTDRHGNTGTVKRIGQNSFSRIAGFVGKVGAGLIDRIQANLPGPLQDAIDAGDVSLRSIPVLVLALLSGTAYGAGFVIKDIIGLIRNPERIGEILTFAALLLNNPGLVFKLPGVLGRTAAQAQQNQNPFANSDLADLENLRTDSLNVIFAIGWYAGATVGFVAGELALEIVGAGIASKLAAFNRVARVINTVRGLRALTAGSFYRLTRWTFSKLTTGARILDSKVLIPVLTRVPTGRQLSVVRQIDAVPDSTRRVVADGGEEELLVAYLRRTGDRGRQLIEGLPDPVSSRLLAFADEYRRGAQLQRRLAEGFSADDVSVEEAGQVVRNYDGFTSAQRDRLWDLVESDGTAGLRFGGLSDDLPTSAFEAGAERQVATLLDLGVPRSGIRRIRDGSIVRPGDRPAGDFDELAELSERDLRRIDYFRTRNTDDASNGFISGQGAAAEFVAEERLLRQLGYSPEEFDLYTGVTFRTPDGNLEIDHVVVRKDSNRIVALGETKSRGTTSQRQEAVGQLETDLEDLSEAREVTGVERAPNGEGDQLTVAAIPETPAEDVDGLFAFGPRSVFDGTSSGIAPDGISRTADTVSLPSERAFRLVAELSERYIASGTAASALRAPATTGADVEVSSDQMTAVQPTGGLTRSADQPSDEVRGRMASSQTSLRESVAIAVR